MIPRFAFPGLPAAPLLRALGACGSKLPVQRIMGVRRVLGALLLTYSLSGVLAQEEDSQGGVSAAGGTPTPVVAAPVLLQTPEPTPIAPADASSTPAPAQKAHTPAATAPEPPPEPLLLTPKAIHHLVDTGKDQEALQALQDYLSANSQDGDLWFLKSQVLTRLGHTDEALQVLRGIVDRFPEMPAPYNNLAVLYAARGQLEEARKNLTLALMVQPDYATAQENLGDVYVALAKHAYQAALILDPRNKALKAKSEKLD